MPQKSKKKIRPSARGEAIRFTRGSYVGKTGWLNTARQDTAHSAHVIINEKQDVANDAEFLACVRKTSIAALRNATTAEEYCIQEDPKVAFHLSKLAQALAECGLPTNQEVLRLIKEQCDLAFLVQVDKGPRGKVSETALRIHKTKEQMYDNMKDQVRSGAALKKGE